VAGLIRAPLPFRTQRPPESCPEATIESLDHEGRGVAHVGGKAVFIEGALPGERVRYRPLRDRATYETGEIVQILRPGSARVEPRCRHYGVCGGCALQHVEYRTQVAAKQRQLEDSLWHIARLRPDHLLRPVYGPPWEYRQRARLSVRLVPKKGGVLVGFHERRSSYVADMTGCEILPARISRLLPALRELVGSLTIDRQLPQIELAIGEHQHVLVLRVLDPLTAGDLARLRAFSDTHGVQFFQQPRGPDTAAPLFPGEPALLEYSLPEFGLRLSFSPTEFTQVNHAVNEVLVRRAVRLLDPQPGERVLDLYCGLGNFTLAIATRGALVHGIEGSTALVARARSNAERNGLGGQASFEDADLCAVDAGRVRGWGRFDRWLIDPPRDGAVELVRSIEAGPGGTAPRRIVYVSCNPATLARDAAVLVHNKGYLLAAAGVVNMFPHTAHVESLAVFEQAATSGATAAPHQ
jgi:23S rRNA (uracil1939-C5)-methyltransferase